MTQSPLRPAYSFAPLTLLMCQMKITEPKTPYVRYDAETDTVMDMDSQ